jgi:hypothetical protein
MPDPLSPEQQQSIEPLSCVPEWCEQQAEPHDETCPEHKLDMTKATFVSSEAQRKLSKPWILRNWLGWGRSSSSPPVVAEEQSDG